MSGTERLILFGGGKLPRLGLETFVGWLARPTDEILIVTWASEEASLTAAVLERRFREAAPRARISISLEPPQTPSERAHFLGLLRGAGGVFFSGGDQNRIALAFDHPEIGEALRAAYLSGIPFAGTSAGTAMMSELMIAGDAPAADSPIPTRAGLGVLGGVVVDQHFFKRKREARLSSVVLRNPELLGIGVDEDTGFAVVGGRYATVVGPERVLLVTALEDGTSVECGLFEPGESVDLENYRPRSARNASTKVS